MNSIIFALVLGAVFGIISSVVVYGYDWRQMSVKVERLQERNARLAKSLSDERAARELENYWHELDNYWRENGFTHECE